MIYETKTKEICYTVCKPVYRDPRVHYTMCKPVYRRTREICYTVCKPVYETKECQYIITKPVYETKTRDVATRSANPSERRNASTVCKPVYETKTHDIATRSANQSETKTRDICYTVTQTGLRDQDSRDLLWSASPSETKECQYTVCKPVYETKTRDIVYTF
jgi:hypothetical protein